MRAKFLKTTGQSDLLTVPPTPEEVTTLQGLSKGGDYVYDVTYTVDYVTALRRGSSKVEIQVRTAPETGAGESLVRDWERDPEGTLRSFLTRGSQARDRARSKRWGGEVILTWVSDFTSRISNSDAGGGLAKEDPGTESSPGGGTRLKPSRTRKGGSRMTTTTAGAAQKNNLVIPVFETNLHVKTPGGGGGHLGVQNTVEVARVATNLLWKTRADPAEVVGTPSGNVVPAARVLGGATTGFAGARQRNGFLTPGQRAVVVDSVLNSLDVRETSELDPDEVIVVPLGEEPDFLTVTERVVVPGQQLGSVWWLVLSLVDREGICLQKTSTLVPHEQFLRKLETVTKPPEVRVQCPVPGRTVLLVSQRDKAATGVNVYKREHKPDLPVLDSEFVFVARVPVTFGSPVSFVDLTPNLNPVSYRVVPYDRVGTLCGEFTGVVTPRVHTTAGTGRGLVEVRPRFVSLMPEVSPEGVTLLARGVPEDVVGVRVLRKDLKGQPVSSPGIKWTPVGDTLRVPGSTSAPLVLVDQTVKPGRSYLYSLLLTYRDGSDQVSSVAVFVDNTPVTANLVTTTLTDPEVVRSGNNLDVEFQMRTELVPTDLDLVNQAIKNQDLLLYFREEIEARRKDLQGIVCYQVTRRDLTSGQVEAFVPTVNRTFSDRQYGPLNNVSPLVPGHEYEYVVSTWFRDTETMLRDLTRDVETRSGGVTRTYSLTPSKWHHPVTLRDGNLVTESSVTRNYGTTEFQLGTLGSQVKTSLVSFVDELPTVVEAEATRFTPRSVVVTWTTSGVPTKFDHFLVLATVHGMRSVVGKCHNITESNTFSFVDVRDPKDHTTITYEVVPVYYNQTRGQGVLTNKVSI